MIIVRGEARLGAGKMENLRPALERAVAAARSEPGCAASFYAIDANDPALLHIGGEWNDEATVDAHINSGHMAELLEALDAAKAEWLRIDAYEGHFLRSLVGEALPAAD